MQRLRSYTTLTALSPIDIMPLVPWAKIAMALQSPFRWRSSAP
jgi:hypothetical protein